MFRFAHPACFLLLAPLALAAFAVLARRVRSAMLFAPTHRLAGLHKTWRTVLQATLPYAFLLGAALIVAALARPRTILSRTTHTTDAIAIMMVIDVSGSMEALDFAGPGQYVTRLDVAKEICGQFIEKRPQDLIGLISFGGYAVTRVPLTTDHAALLHSLKGVRVPPLIFDERGRPVNAEERRTAIGDALAAACARLEGADVESRVVVFLSDGESNFGIIRPDAAIEAARTLGLKVHTIGIGSNARAPFMTRDRFGQSVIQYAQVTLDEDLLRRMAERTGGRYFHVNDPSGMELALRDIDRLERTEIEHDLFHHHNELFNIFLVPGALLLGIAATANVMIARRIV